MPVLYLVEQGASLKKDGDTLLVTKDNEVLQTVPAAKVEQVVIFGNVNITTPVIHYLLEQGIDCSFCSSTGRYHGRLFSTESKFGLLRRSQLEAATRPGLRLAIAAAVVKGKLSNQRTMMMRYLREAHHPDIEAAVEGTKDSLDKLEKASDVGSVQGIEGYASLLYYRGLRAVLKQDLGFHQRVRRPPRDPVNSLLSFGYTLLTYSVEAAVRTVGLDPFIGFLHSTEYSKPSLALDMMEEFRPVIVDSIVLRTINNQMLTAEDFERGADPSGMVKLKPDAIRKFLGLFEERMQTVVSHPVTHNQASYRRCIELQVRHLARVVTGNTKEYQPFLVK